MNGLSAGLPKPQNVMHTHGVMIITSSRSYTIAVSGTYRVSCLGAGGRGTIEGGGGGGAGFCEKTVRLGGGTILTLTVGAGVPVHGAAGGASAVVGAGINLLANGGSGGNGATGGAGGSASGGDYNFTGAAGGSRISGTYGGGGGAAGSFFTSAAGGDAGSVPGAGGGVGCPYIDGFIGGTDKFVPMPRSDMFRNLYGDTTGVQMPRVSSGGAGIGGDAAAGGNYTYGGNGGCCAGGGGGYTGGYGGSGGYGGGSGGGGSYAGYGGSGLIVIEQIA